MSFNYKKSNNMRDVCTFFTDMLLMIIEIVMERHKKTENSGTDRQYPVP